MTIPTEDYLEARLRELTEYKGEDTNLWQRAIAAGEAPEGGRVMRLLSRPLPRPGIVAAAACIAVVFGVGFLVPSLHSARKALPSAASSPSQGPTSWERVGIGQDSLGVQEGARFVNELGGFQVDGVVSKPISAPHMGYVGKGSIEKPDDTTRQVIQKATIEIQTPDVRAAFARANHLVSAAGGEFVENTSLTGDGKTAQANITLRVGVARLGEVMNRLRELGQVKSENTTGEDVTSQAVDLEARIRNEQRVEKELLELLDKRADAPLKDVLELRNSLSSVRQSIEQYIAQRDKLGRLVSLASILVVIRAEPVTDKPEAAPSIAGYFTHTIADAWRGGLRTASDSVSWVLSVLVGGALWWTVLGMGVYAIFRYRRRLAARCV